MVLAEFNVPLYLTVGKRKPKNHWLTLNNYRNWKFYLSNDLKTLFKETLNTDVLIAIEGEISVTYTFYYPTKQLRDIDGSLAVISKFTLDALVEGGIIQDDNYTIVKKVSGEYGGLDKENPRCEVKIERYSNGQNKNDS
jgi:Holliday junction resolvase RusA-like endonuclease